MPDDETPPDSSPPPGSGYPPGPGYPPPTPGGNPQQPGTYGQSYGGYQQPGPYGQQPGSYPPGGGYPPPGAHGQQPGYPGAYPLPEPPRKTGWSGLAIAGFVVAFIPVVGLLVGVPLAIAGLVGIKRRGGRGKGLAIAGIIVALVISALVVVGVVAVVAGQAERDASGRIVGAGTLDFADIRSGDCLDLSGLADDDEVSVSYGDLEGVPCDETHNAQAYALVNVGQGDYDAAEVEGRVSECSADYPSAATADDRPLPLYPNEDLWDENEDNDIVCLVVRSDYSDVTGDLVE